MWFKQIQILQMNDSLNITPQHIMEKLKLLIFKPCLPSMPFSLGWVSPLDSEMDELPLGRTINGYIMLCLQIEEKILPATVIRQELIKQIKKIEHAEARKIGQQEKLALKDEIMVTLLPRAFTKLTKIYAYIDTKQRKIILGSANGKRTEQFISLFNKSLQTEIHLLKINNISPMMTQWVKNQNYPSVFAIEKLCMLQDPNSQGRIIRCQQQDLFTISIQSLIKDGCEVKQLALNWQDRIKFVLSDILALTNIKFQEEVTAQTKEMEPESQAQQFDADLLIMSDIFSQLLNDLLTVLHPQSQSEKNIAPKEALA